MSLPTTLKGLHELCQQNNIKYKGKTKSVLHDLLVENWEKLLGMSTVMTVDTVINYLSAMAHATKK